MEIKSISTQTLQRLPKYLNYLKSLPKDGAANISATAIAGALNLNDVQVRKDLASVSNGGRPKIGYLTSDLIDDLEQYLGYDDAESAVIVGAGNLGSALLSYNGFTQYGLNIVVAFDVKEDMIGTCINNKQIFAVNKLKDLCSRMKIRLGIITVPENAAQEVCNALVDSGVLAIWNFANIHLSVPDGVLVHNQNMVSSLAVLSKHLAEKLYLN